MPLFHPAAKDSILKWQPVQWQLAYVEEVASASQSLAETAQNLQMAVEKFRG